MMFSQRRSLLPKIPTLFKQRSLSLLLVVTLSACQTVSVNSPEMQSIIPLEWPQERQQSGTVGVDPQQLAWWDYFNDPMLRQVIADALAHNRDLKLAVLRVAEAEAILQLRRSDLWPTTGLDGQASRRGLPAELSPTGASQVGAEYGLMVGLNSWELDLWGRIRHLNDAALEEFLAGSYARHAVQAGLIAEVARVYLSLQTLDEQIDIAQKSIASRQESYRIFKRRYEVGASSLLELTQVETLLMQARVLLSQLQQQRGDLLNAFRVLVAKPSDFNAPGMITKASYPKGGAVDTAFSPIAVGLPSEVLLQRPDIVAAEHRLRASRANIAAARAAYFPRIALTAGAGTASAQLKGLFDGGSGTWLFAPVISLAIFDGGARAANLQASEIRSQMAVVEYEKAIQQAFKEVSDALNHRLRLQEQVHLGQRVVQIQQERARLAQLRYDSGAVSYLDVLDAQRDLLTARQQLAQDQGGLRLSEVALYSALGGGTQVASDYVLPMMLTDEQES
ncbi:MAG: efflux transporter outer membrane subunit [Alcaligenaceae bacterium]|nr:efflux transporter outer membrane subunit [Alcaligenaceae bacterium]